jgi:protein TonB
MERHFTLPVSIAVALHAGVFFGFHRVPAAAHAPKGDTVVVWQPTNLPPPEPELMPDPDPTEAKAPASTPLPRSAENYTKPQPTDFTMERPPLPEVSTTNLKELGQPVGFDTGPGKLPDILSSLQLDNPPRARAQVSPQYPTEAKSHGLTGKVTVEFVVDEGGRVLAPRIVESTDHIFNEAAIRAVAKWRFEPGRASGRIVRFRMMVPIVFNLSE